MYPLRRGLGTVDVVITAVGGLPSADTVKAVQTYIDRVRPVTAKDCQVLAPTLKTTDVVVSVGLSANTTLADVTPGITAALKRYFDALIPGQEAIATQMGALVSDVPGVLDYSLTAPKGNIIPTVDGTTVQWVRQGKVTVSELKAST
ncbi:Baseplate J-like protein [compost metagenome]